MVENRTSNEQLCMDLLQADTEEQVIAILREQGYWDVPGAWKFFGDREDNFPTIGNQSRNADRPLVEKLINSVDAVLMGECLSAGTRPNSSRAPQSIPEAVAEFFSGDRSNADSQGHVSAWDTKKRREMSSRITLAATGSRKNPSFTIVDSGEGQTPNSMPKTLLSIDRSNKIDVHFVQGTFNMGGTGALRFCGRDNLQLIISRRNPDIQLDREGDASFSQWGFTVVRRENPSGTRKTSTYTYLAPEQGEILSFSADMLPLFPSGNVAYARDTQWGTVVKLYEYKLKGKSHILRKDGLLHRLDILLPYLALPIRLHECRNFRGNSGSYDTTLNGLGVRLSDDRRQNLEQGFPTSSTLTIDGEHMTVKIYAFKRGKADTYRKGEGIVFLRNGQTHGTLPRRFFSRRSVGMNRLDDSILVILDCSSISRRSQEDLFMNNRDGLEDGDFLQAIEEELESLLREHPRLRSLRESRRREDAASMLEDSKPFQEVLNSILSKSPSLASLFGGTGPLSNPFKSQEAPVSEFEGKPHPTYFRFRKKDYGHVLQRETPANMRSRIIFETDVESDYFERERFGGQVTIVSLDEKRRNGTLPNNRLNLSDGVATLNLRLPGSAAVGDTFQYEVTVQDETLVEPFVNKFVIKVKPEQESRPTPPNPRPDPKNTLGLAVPKPIFVYEKDWDKYEFNGYTALKATHDPSEDQEGSGSHTFYINMDNIYLLTELKATKEAPDILKSRWQFGMMIIGLALLKDQEDSVTETETISGTSVERDSNLTPEEHVQTTTEAIAPVLLPLIEHLGRLSSEEITKLGR